MFGAELHELFAFFRQVGLALAGATSLWAFVFLWKARRSKGEKRDALEWASRRLILLFSGGFALAVLSWFVLWNIWPVLAHEGVTLFPTSEESRQAFFLTVPVYILWIFFTLAAFLYRAKRKVSFEKFSPIFFAIQFAIVSVLISLYAWTGDVFSNSQIFFYFHGFHSIFTLGTVLTLDFIFLSTRRSMVLQRHIFPFFPTISKIIFIGLGLDFLSVTLVFGDALEMSPRFFAAQTIVGILIINGVILSGVLTRKILKGLKEGRMLGGKWKKIAGICGPISITSWTAITFIDFFPNLTLSYISIMSVYFSVILCGIIANLLLERYDARQDAISLEMKKPISL